MTSPLLAMFVRSLREESRSKAVYWARSGMGVFILLMLAMTAIASIWAGSPGRDFFTKIVILQALSITFIGLSYFASAVTEEKEEDTLGLLRMTDLNPLAILLGKSTSRLFGALLLLACQFPFTVFAVTLGGISLGQIGAAYFALAAYTFMLCNIALLGSVLTRTTPPRPTGDPVRWRDFYFIYGGRKVMILRSLLYGGVFVYVLWKIEGIRGFDFSPIFVAILALFVLSLDLAAISARVFRSEIRDQTLSALAGLPCTMRRLAFRKAAAGVFAALPGLVILGAALSIIVIKIMGSSMRTKDQLMAFVMIVNGCVAFVLGVHVVAWISLFMKRGAMAVGYIATLAAYWLIWMICMLLATTVTTAMVLGSSSSASAMWFFAAGPLVVLFLCMGLALILFLYIPSRLATLAAEG